MSISDLRDLDMDIFAVGGCVRDEILGLPTKDIDFTIVVDNERFTTAEAGFAHMESELERAGFKIWQTRPEFQTIRAQFPPELEDSFGTRDADFVMARKDGPYSDGRRPDYVVPGTLADDLARRDFTMNAIAKDADGNFIDPFDGIADLEKGLIRFVGNPADRIAEDGLRVMRAFRFAATKDMAIDIRSYRALVADESIRMLNLVATERKADEIRKMFAGANLVTVLGIMSELDSDMLDAMFAHGDINLIPTMKTF